MDLIGDDVRKEPIIKKNKAVKASTQKSKTINKKNNKPEIGK